MVTITQEVDQCYSCPYAIEVTSIDKRFKYDICRAERRILPSPQTFKPGKNIMSWVINIPDWCPFNKEGKVDESNSVRSR